MKNRKNKPSGKMLMITATRLLIAASVLMVVSQRVQAAPQPSMDVAMSAKTFFMGEEFTYEVLISPSPADVKISADELEGDDELAIKFLGQTRSEHKGMTSTSLRYRMMPLRSGAIMMPVFSIEVGEHTFTTEEEEFIYVKKAEGYPGLTLSRELPQRDLYIGEPFYVDYTWKSPLSLNGYRALQFDLPLFYDQAFSVWTPHAWIADDDKAAIGIPVASARVIAKYSSITEAGQELNAVSFRKIIIPAKTGEFPLSPSTLLTSYAESAQSRGRGQGWKTNYPSYFNNNFFSAAEGGQETKYLAQSKPQNLLVLPLPDAGKPHDFGGLVGKCNITVTATPTVLSAGDPITLTVVIDGYEFPEVFELPNLGEQLAFTRQFAIPARQSSGRIVGKKKTYIRTLRPLGPDTAMIPAVRVPYFDPETKTYGVAESAPIPVTVKPSEMVTAFDAKMTGAGPLRNHLDKNKAGIRANVASLESIRARTFTPMHWLIILLIAPPLAYALFCLVTKRQRLQINDPIKARAIGALKRFRKSISKIKRAAKQTPADKLERLDDAVRSYFADKLNMVRHAHTFEELGGMLPKRVDAKPLQRIYTVCAQERYRGESQGETPDMTEGEVTQLIKQAEQCILTIHKAI